MTQTKKILMSIGTALAASKLVRTISRIEFEDVLGSVGLARRRNYALANLALIGVGAALGAGTALLLTPMSGRETRQRISEQASRLGQVAKEAIREHKEEVIHTLSDLAGGNISPHHSEHSFSHG